MKDDVNHPEHYQSHKAECSRCGHSIECIDITRHMNFNIGNAMKYLWRYGKKDDSKSGKIKDLQKAIWYIQDEIEEINKTPYPHTYMTDTDEFLMSVGDPIVPKDRAKEEEEKAKELKLEVGKTYRSRCGEIYHIDGSKDNHAFPYYSSKPYHDDDYFTWKENGRFLFLSRSDFDLIEEIIK